MEVWKRYFERGKGDLSRHNPAGALKNLQIALKECPASENKNLSKVLFYTGVTLNKLGVPNGALRSWIVAQKLNKSGHCSKMIKRFVNDYGMTKQRNSYLDDWKAFHAVHLAKYLRIKSSGTITNPAEKDMIDELIRDAWIRLRSEANLDSLDAEKKMAVFKDVKIIFPFYSYAARASARNPISVNFREKKRYSLSDRCTCGSGLIFSKCCGRTLGEDELINGSF